MSLESWNKDIALFNEKAEKLDRCSFTHTVFTQQTGWTISFETEPQSNMAIQRVGPGEESMDAFVLTFRFFIQNNEKTSFQNMSAVYEQLAVKEEIKEAFKSVRAELNNFLDEKTFWNIDNVQLTRRHIMETFIYGGLSHANEQKKREYDLWMMNLFTQQPLTNEFVFTVASVLKVIFYIYKLNQHAYADSQGLQIVRIHHPPA